MFHCWTNLIFCPLCWSASHLTSCISMGSVSHSFPSLPNSLFFVLPFHWYLFIEDNLPPNQIKKRIPPTYLVGIPSPVIREAKKGVVKESVICFFSAVAALCPSCALLKSFCTAYLCQSAQQLHIIVANPCFQYKDFILNISVLLHSCCWSHLSHSI